MTFTMDLSYLVVRFDLNGANSMRALGFVDFLSLASPILVAASETNELLNFILAPKARGAESYSVDPGNAVARGSLVNFASTKPRRNMLRWAEPLVALLALTSGAILIYLVNGKANINHEKKGTRYMHERNTKSWFYLRPT